MQWKKLVYFLLLNVLVSSITTLVVLAIWDRSHQTETPEPVSSTPAFMIPTATQEAPASETEVSLQAYQVKEGETLGEIALAFDVTVDELLALNSLTDPNSIGAGTTIFVPAADVTADSGSEEEVTSEGSVPTAMNTGQVEIVGIFGAGDLASERLQIKGLGEGTLSLTGWLLRDEDGNEYFFPKITLFGNGAVDVNTAAGVDTVVALYWNSGEAIWEAGETATLIDGDGTIQATYTIP